MENENDRIVSEPLTWSYLIYGREFKKRKRKRKISSEEGLGDEYNSYSEDERKKFFKFHYACACTIDECITLKTYVKLAKVNRASKNQKKNKQTKQEVNILVEKSSKKH